MWPPALSRSTRSGTAGCWPLSRLDPPLLPDNVSYRVCVFACDFGELGQLWPRRWPASCRVATPRQPQRSALRNPLARRGRAGQITADEDVAVKQVGTRAEASSSRGPDIVGGGTAAVVLLH